MKKKIFRERYSKTPIDEAIEEIVKEIETEELMRQASENEEKSYKNAKKVVIDLKQEPKKRGRKKSVK